MAEHTVTEESIADQAMLFDIAKVKRTFVESFPNFEDRVKAKIFVDCVRSVPTLDLNSSPNRTDIYISEHRLYIRLNYNTTAHDLDLIKIKDSFGVARYKFRFILSNDGSNPLPLVRKEFHDVLLNILLLTSKINKSDTRVRQNNNLTDPVLNDGLINDNVIELKTYLPYQNKIHYSVLNAFSKQLQHFYNQYKPFITNNNLDTINGVMRGQGVNSKRGFILYNINISKGGDLYNHLLTFKEKLHAKVLLDLMDHIDELNDIYLDYTDFPKEEDHLTKQTEEKLIQDFDDYIHKHLSSESLKYLDEMMDRADGINGKEKFFDKYIGEKTVPEIEQEIIKDVRECIPNITRDFIEDFHLSTVECCNMIPTLAGDVNVPGLLDVKHNTGKAFDRKYGMLTSLGARRGCSKFENLQRTLMELITNPEIYHVTGKSDKKIELDNTQCKSVVNIIKHQCLLTDDDWKLVEDLARQTAQLNNIYQTSEKKIALEKLGVESVEELDERRVGLLTSAEKNETRYCHFHSNGAIVLDGKQSCESMGLSYKAKGDRELMCARNEQDLQAGTELLQSLLDELPMPDEDELNRIVGTVDNLNLESFVHPNYQQQESSKCDIKNSYKNVREFFKNNITWYRMQSLELSRTYQATFESVLTKKSPLNSFRVWRDDTEFCIYIASVGKSKTQTGSIMKLLKFPRKPDETKQESFDRIIKSRNKLDVGYRGGWVTSTHVIVLTQTFRYSVTTFRTQEEYLGSWFGLWELCEGLGMKMVDPLIPSFYLDYKRRISATMDFIYLMYKQTGGAGTPGKFDMPKKLDPHFYDIREVLTTYRVKTYFTEFNKLIRTELVASNGWKFSKKIYEPLFNTEIDTMVQVALVCWLKNGGWKDDGMDQTKYLFDFVVKELGHEVTAKDHDWANIPARFEDKNLLQWYEDRKIMKDGKKAYKKLDHNLKLTYQLAYITGARIREQVPKGGLTMTSFKQDKGTPSSVLVPVPKFVINQVVAGGKIVVEESLSRVIGGDHVDQVTADQLRKSGGINIIKKRIAIINALKRVKSSYTEDSLSWWNSVIGSLAVLDKNKVEKLQAVLDKRMENHIRSSSEKKVVVKSDPLLQVFHNNKVVKIQEEEKDVDEDAESGKDPEEYPDSDTSSEISDDAIPTLHHVMDNEVEEQGDGYIRRLLDETGEFETEVPIDEVDKNGVPIGKFINYLIIFWSLLPMPSNADLTMHSDIQQNVLYASLAAYMVVHNMKVNPSMLELACFVDKVEECQTTVRAALKNQYGYDKRAFFIQTFNSWLRNKVAEEFMRTIINFVDQDVIHLPGNQKNVKLENMMRKYPEEEDIFKMTADRTKYGDTYSLYVLSIQVVAMRDAGLITPEQCKYMVFTHGCLANRNLLVPTSYVAYLNKQKESLIKMARLEKVRTEVDNLTHLEGYVYEAKGFDKLDDINDLLKKYPVHQTDAQLRENSVTLNILNLLSHCSYGDGQDHLLSCHTMTHAYIKRTIGFVLGVLNFQGSFGSALCCILAELCLNNYFDGLLYQAISHSDDSTATAYTGSMDPDFMKTASGRLEIDTMCMLIKEGYTFHRIQQNNVTHGWRAYKDGLEHHDEKLFSNHCLPVIIAAFDIAFAGAMGQLISGAKCIYQGNTGEFLQLWMHKGRVMPPFFRSTSAILRPMGNTCPHLDTLSIVSRVYDIIMNSCDADLVKNSLFFGNWFIKYKFRLPKDYEWDTFTNLLGSFWGTSKDIILHLFSANDVRLLSYALYGADEEIKHYIKNCYFLSEKTHKHWLNFTEDEEVTDSMAIDATGESDFLRTSSKMMWKLVFTKKRKASNKARSIAKGLLTEQFSVINKFEGKNDEERIKKYVTSKMHEILVNNATAPTKLARTVLTLTNLNISMTVSKLPNGALIRGNMGYLNRIMIQKIGKDSIRKAKIGDIINRVKELARSDNKEYIINDQYHIQTMWEADLKSYETSIKMIRDSSDNGPWLVENGGRVNVDFIRIDHYRELMPTFYYQIKEVRSKEGITTDEAQKIASFFMERALLADEHMSKHNKIYNLRLEDSFVYNAFPAYCSTPEFKEKIINVTSLLNITNTPAAELSPQLQAWMTLVSGAKHIIIMKCPMLVNAIKTQNFREENANFFTFIYTHLAKRGYIFLPNSETTDAIMKFTQPVRRYRDNETTLETYRLLLSVATGSKIYNKKGINAIHKINIESNFLEILRTREPTPSIIDNLLARILWLSKFNTNEVVTLDFKRVQRMDQSSDYFIQLSDLWVLFRWVNLGDDGNNKRQWYYTTNVSNLREFNFLVNIMKKCLISKEDFQDPLLGNKEINLKTNVHLIAKDSSSLVSSNQFGTHYYIRLVQNESVNGEFAKIMTRLERDNGADVDMNLEKMCWSNASFTISPWEYKEDTDIEFLNNDREPLTQTFVPDELDLNMLLWAKTNLPTAVINNMETDLKLTWLTYSELVAGIIQELYHTPTPEFEYYLEEGWDETTLPASKLQIDYYEAITLEKKTKFNALSVIARVKSRMIEVFEIMDMMWQSFNEGMALRIIEDNQKRAGDRHYKTKKLRVRQMEVLEKVIDEFQLGGYDIRVIKFIKSSLIMSFGGTSSSVPQATAPGLMLEMYLQTNTDIQENFKKIIIYAVLKNKKTYKYSGLTICKGNAILTNILKSQVTSIENDVIDFDEDEFNDESMTVADINNRVLTVKALTNIPTPSTRLLRVVVREDVTEIMKKLVFRQYTYQSTDMLFSFLNILRKYPISKLVDTHSENQIKDYFNEDVFDKNRLANLSVHLVSYLQTLLTYYNHGEIIDTNRLKFSFSALTSKEKLLLSLLIIMYLKPPFENGKEASFIELLRTVRLSNEIDFEIN